MIDFQWADPIFSGRICLTLIHSLWQVALFALLASAAARVVRQQSAERSYRFHLAALFASLVVIPVTYSVVKVAESPVTTMSGNGMIPVTGKFIALESQNLKFEDLNPAVSPPAAFRDEINSESNMIPPSTPSAMTQLAEATEAPAWNNLSWQKLAPWIAAFYVIGVIAMLLRLMISMVLATRLRSGCPLVTESRLLATVQAVANRYSMKLVPVLMQAERVLVPQVVGLIRPVILLPTSALTGLTADELELILMHELAHVRRYDMWIALIQRLAEALLFFNPALWFLSRRISELREFCCDDIACRVDLKGSDPLLAATDETNENGMTGSDPFKSTHVRYAQALLKVVEMSRPNSSTHSQLASLAASGRSPSELRRRMARLLGEPLREPVQISRGGLLLCMAVVIGVLFGPGLFPGMHSENHVGADEVVTTVFTVHDLPSLIAAVEKNERLYAEIDLKVQYHHLRADASSFESERWIVRQGQKYYASENNKYAELDGEIRHSTDAVAFDGVQTSIAEDGATTREEDGREETHLAIFPHMLLFSTLRVPLSVFLRGTDALRADPYGQIQGFSPSRKSETIYVGTEEVNGLRCHRVAVRINDGKVSREFWLAEERNFLVVRSIEFTAKALSDIPDAEGEVDAFQEVAPNVWIPAHGTYTLFNRSHLKETREQILQWKETFRTKEVSLKPEHPDDFFKPTFVRSETHRTFRLTVNGPDGKPVPNASCEIRDTAALKAEQILDGAFVENGAYGTFTKTNENGQLALSLPKELHRLSISIEHSGFGPFWARWDTSDGSAGIPDEATIELENAWSVGGVVVDETGAPIEGVGVSPSIYFKKLPGDTEKFGVGASVKTDGEGKWRYDLVPVSKDYVFASFDHPKHQPLRMPLSREDYELKSGESPSKPIALPSGVTITGRVIDDQGQPIENALVRTKFVNEIREAKTDKDGKYQIGGCEPKITRIVASAKGRAMELQELLVDPRMQPVEFTLQPGGHVRVRVVDADGKGLAKSRIFFQRWRGHIDYFEFNGINQYADDNGVWEWNEAPLDEFQADICRPGGFQLSYQPLIAREVEYVFSPPPALVISGKAIDAVTKEPVLKYSVVPGTQDEPGQKPGDNWDLRDRFESTDGDYRIVRTDDAPFHRLRFEAVGYKVATSRDIKMDEGTIEINVELQPGKIIAPVVLTPQGKPASGARIALGLVGDQISIRNGDLRDDNTYATKMTADAGGRFSMPDRSDPFLMVIMHPEGFASLTNGAPIPEKIELSEWARAEGTYRISGEPAANITVEFHGRGIQSFGDIPNQPSVQIATFGKTDADGRYVLERVFPGTGRIGRSISFMVNDGATEATSTKLAPAEFQSGETRTIDFGGSKQAVTGKLLPPAGVAEPVAWSFARITVEADIPVPPTPLPPADIGDDAEKQNKWYEAWMESPEGKNWMLKYQAAEAQRGQVPYYTVSVDRDGSFRIDDIPAGSYNLQFYGDKRLPGSLPDIKFTVPAESDAASLMDLGELQLIAK